MTIKHILSVLAIIMLFATEASSQRAADYEKKISTAQELLTAGEQAKCLVVTNHIIDSYSGIKDRLHTDSIIIMKAEYLCGQANIALGNNVRGLKLLKSAVDYAKNIADTKFLAKVYNSLFNVYYNSHDYIQAIDLLNMAIELSTDAKDTSTLIRLYNNRGLAYYSKHNYAEALTNMRKALSLTSTTGSMERSQIYTNMAEVYYVRQQYAEAEHWLALAINERKDNGITSNSIQTYLNMALVKARLGKYAEAKGVQYKLCNVLPHLTLPVKVNSIRQLAEINFVVGDSIKGLRYMLAYDELLDSLKRQDNNSQLRQLLVAYDTERLSQHNEALKHSLRTKNIIVYGSVGFMIMVIVFTIILWIKTREDKRKSMLIAAQKEQLLKYEQEEHERKQKKMTLELEHKNRQLTSYTIDLAAVNEFHQKMTSELNNLHHMIENIACNAEERKNIDESFNNVKNMINHFNDKPVNDDFRIYFEEVHPYFLKNLSKTYPKLSDTDLRLCAYLLLGMSTKEIAALTYREVRSIESSRLRLRKKLGLESGVDVKAFLEAQNKHFNTMQ